MSLKARLRAAWRQIKRPFAWSGRWLRGRAEILSALSSLVAIVTLPLALLGGYLAYKELTALLQLPDARLAFDHVEQGAVTFVIANDSDVVAESVRYEIMLYARTQAGAPWQQPLIPTTILDPIRPHWSSGPYNLWRLAHHKEKIRDARDLMGQATVTCPRCAVARHYLFVFLGADREGSRPHFWAAEIPDRTQAQLRDLLGAVATSEKTEDGEAVTIDSVTHLIEQAVGQESNS